MALQKFFPVDEVALVHSGPEYFDRIIEIINGSKKDIHFHNYIFATDATGELIADVLIKAAKRGIKIYILLDSFGSVDLKDSDLEKSMEAAGIRVRFFSPYYLSSGIRVGRRMHQKVLVADGNVALVGGINVSDDYHGTPEKKAWLDYGVLMRGNICEQLVVICKQLESSSYYTTKKLLATTSRADDKPMVRLRQSDYLRSKRQISRSYQTAIAESRKEIIIVNAYFLPGTRLRHLIERAAKRGVKIHVILAAKSDVKMVQRAMNWFYDWLVRHDIKIYEYSEANVHAKVAIFDSELAMVGSYNLNYLSEYLSVELNVDIRDAAFVNNFRTELLDLINSDCTLVDAAALKKRVLSNRFINYLSYRFVSFSERMLYIMTRKDRVNMVE